MVHDYSPGGRLLNASNNKYEHVRTKSNVTPMLTPNPNWYLWCWPGTLNGKLYESLYCLWSHSSTKYKVSQIPCNRRSGPQQNSAKSQWHHSGQDHWWSHVSHNKEAINGQSRAGLGQLWGILQQSVETYPDWWYACQGLGPPEPELLQGRGQVWPSRPGPYQWRPSQRSEHVKAQPWPAPGERCQQGYHNQG